MAIKRCPADAAFSTALRMVRGNRCEHCHAKGRTECAHIYGRRHKAVRWDTMNALSLCHTCHRRFTENPIEFVEWLNTYVGEDYLQILREKRNGIFKVNKQIRADIAKHYRDQIKALENGANELVSYQ